MWVPACLIRSEEHTSELQSPCNFVCRLLLERNSIHQASPYVPVSPYVDMYRYLDFPRCADTFNTGDTHSIYSRKAIPMVSSIFFFLMIRRTTRSTLFPYTTLFRS